MRQNTAAIAEPKQTTMQADVLVVALTWFFSAAGLSIFALTRGQDINYDLMNYHRFTLFAALSDEPFRHVAGLQQFLNPFVFLPHFVLNTLFNPKIAAVALSSLQALNVPLVYVLALLLLSDLPAGVAGRRYIALGTAAVAVSGPLFLTEIGTSFPDSLGAIPIIGGLCFLLAALGASPAKALWFIGIGGFLLGAAAGLKLTNTAFAVSAFISLLVIGDLRYRFRNISALVFGGCFGGLITGGYWSYLLYDRFSSPIFPFYNQFFRSPFYPVESIADRRFLPETLIDALSYPFQWVFEQHPSSELPFRNLRFGALIVLLSLVPVVAILHRVRRSKTRDYSINAPLTYRRALFIVVFTIFGFALWIGLFGVQRYLIPVELIAGISILSTLILLRLHLRSLLILSTGITVAVCAWSRFSDFGHSPWTLSVAEVRLPKIILQSNGIFLLLGDPTTYVVPDFGREARFFNIGMFPDPKNAMGQMFADVVRAHSGPIYSISGGLLGERTLKFFNAFGLRQDGIDCIHFASYVGARMVGLGLCPVSLNPRSTPTIAATYRLGRTIEFGGPARNSVFYEIAGWGEQHASGRMWDPAARELRLRFEIAESHPGRMVAELRLVNPVDRCSFTMKVNDKALVSEPPRSACFTDKLSFEVPAELIEPSGDFDLVLARIEGEAANPVVLKSLTLRAAS